MRVLREEERAGGVLGGAVLDDGLRDGEDVRVVEAGVERGAAMAGGTEADALRGDAGVGVVGVEGGDQARDVDQAVGGGEMAGRVGERVGDRVRGHGRKHTAWMRKAEWTGWGWSKSKNGRQQVPRLRSE